MARVGCGEASGADAGWWVHRLQLSCWAQQAATAHPSYSILGSFFPVWIFCFLAGLLLTALVRLLLRRWKIEGHLTPVARDRVVGVLLGLIAMWLVFDPLWAPRAGARMQTMLATILDQLARLSELVAVLDLQQGAPAQTAMLELRPVA